MAVDLVLQLKTSILPEQGVLPFTNLFQTQSIQAVTGPP